MPSKDAYCYIYFTKLCQTGANFEKVKGAFMVIVGKLTGCQALL